MPKMPCISPLISRLDDCGISETSPNLTAKSGDSREMEEIVPRLGGFRRPRIRSFPQTKCRMYFPLGPISLKSRLTPMTGEWPSA